MYTGCALLLGGDARQAAELFSQALATARRFRVALFHEGIMLARLAEALRQTGRPEEALATNREAVAVARRQGALVWCTGREPGRAYGPRAWRPIVASVLRTGAQQQRDPLDLLVSLQLSPHPIVADLNLPGPAPPV